MMSRSRKVSFLRRALPASETFTAAGCSRRTETTASNAPSPSPSRRRSEGSCFFSASAFRIRSSVFAPRPLSVRSCSCSAACLRSSIVVTPSSRQIRAADLGRDDFLALRQSVHLAVLDDLHGLLLDRLPDSLELLGAAVEGELGHGPGRLTDSGRRPPIGEDAEGGLSFELEQVGEELELVGDIHVPRQSTRQPTAPSHSSRSRPRGPTGGLREAARSGGPSLGLNIRRCLEPSFASRPTTNARTSSRCCARSATKACTSWSSTTTRPTAPESWPTAWPESSTMSASSTATARRGSGRPTSRAFAARWPTAPSWCWRWTATSPTLRTTCRG